MRQKLFTKQIDDMLFKQYPLGNDLSKQMVVTKIFNPYGRGVWYLLNSDPNDPEYLWAIVDLYEVEVGSVSREDLQTIKVPPFGLNLERDMYFQPINAKELLNGLMNGKTYAEGGATDVNVVADKADENFLVTDDAKPSDMTVKLANGGTVDSLVGRTVHIYMAGVKEPIKDKIVSVRVTPEQFSKREVIMKFKDGSEERLPLSKLDEFMAHEQLQLRDSKGEPYAIELCKTKYEYADGGAIKGSNTKTGERFGVVIGSIKKSDEYVDGGTEMNVRNSYSSRMSEVKLVFDSKGNLHTLIDYGSSTDGYPSTSGGSAKTYNVDKKETIKILSEKYSPSFAKKLVDSLTNKMAMGGKTTFKEKVKSISQSLLKRKKVSPSVQKDYGKTYDKKEAVDSAKRIAGAMRAKEMAKKKR
jgi:uncharacterized protein (UPF0254 family)